MGVIDEKYLQKLKRKYPEFNFTMGCDAYKGDYYFEIEGALRSNYNYHLRHVYPHDDIVYRPNLVMEYIEKTLIPRAIKEAGLIVENDCRRFYELMLEDAEKEGEKDMPVKSDFKLSDLLWQCIDNYLTPSSFKKVIFNGPATIVIWNDNSKTVVKVKEGEEFDPWVGIAMCHMKRMYGNKFHSNFTKWTKEYYEKEEILQNLPPTSPFGSIVDSIMGVKK